MYAVKKGRRSHDFYGMFPNFNMWARKMHIAQSIRIICVAFIHFVVFKIGVRRLRPPNA